MKRRIWSDIPGREDLKEGVDGEWSGLFGENEFLSLGR